MPPPQGLALRAGLACRLQAWRRQLAAAALAAPPPQLRSHRRRQARQLYASPPCAQLQQNAELEAAAPAASTSSGSGSSSASEAAPINKQVVGKAMDDRLYSYLLRHTREPDVLAQLRADTATQFATGARMQISPEQGAFMGWLVQALGARRVIEVGVFTGYSSVAMALALPPGGRLVACDRDPAAMALAREYWQRAGVADKIDERLGPAGDTLDALLADPEQHSSYDFAFIDADKKGYRRYYEQLLQLVRPGGVIAVDNVLWYGKVADPAVTDSNTQALRDLNDFLLGDDRITLSIVPVGDGMALCMRR